jgi:hypothetical protein
VKLLAATAIIGCYLLAGCGSTQEVDTGWLESDTTSQRQTTLFETRTDTVATVGAKHVTESSSPYNSSLVRFMVQIGAFRDPLFASTVQATARLRYKLPVVNDYNAGRRLYQIRIGFFEAEEAARAFIAQLRTEYPHDYKDAWIVQIGR